MSKKNKDSNIIIKNVENSYLLVPYKDFQEGRREGLVLQLDKQASINNGVKVVITNSDEETPSLMFFSERCSIYEVEKLPRKNYFFVENVKEELLESLREHIMNIRHTQR